MVVFDVWINYVKRIFRWNNWRKKSYDARAYYANKRGTIALIDSKKSIVVGLVDLVRVHKIDANGIVIGMQLVDGVD